MPTTSRLSTSTMRAAGLTKVRDGLSRSTLYAYDAAGRLNKVTHPDLSFVSFTYDLAGRPHDQSPTSAAIPPTTLTTARID